MELCNRTFVALTAESDLPPVKLPNPNISASNTITRLAFSCLKKLRTRDPATLREVSGFSKISPPI